MVDGVVVFLEFRAHLADVLFQGASVGLRETAERGFPGFLEGAAGNGATVNHENLLSLGDGIGHDVRGDLHLVGAGERLYGISFRLVVQGVDNDLVGMRIRSVKEMVIRGREYLVKILFLEKGFLRLEAVFAEKGGECRIGVDRLVLESLGHSLLEKQLVRVEETETETVARESPVAVACDSLFEKRKIEEQAELAVDDRVLGGGERHGILESFAEDDVLDGGALRNGKRLLDGVGIQGNQQARGECVAVPLQESEDQVKVCFAEVFELVA